MAMAGNLTALRKHCPKVLQTIAVHAPANGDWSAIMPVWKSKGHGRGLLGWGETRDEDGKIVSKAGALNAVQRAAATRACATYMRMLGYPPVVAGVSLKKAIRDGTVNGDVTVERPRGQTRGQTTLVPAPAPNDYDLWSVFVVVSATLYLRELKPSPVRGTLATVTVLGYFSQEKPKLKLLANIKTQLYRVTNRPLLQTCCKTSGLHQWIHAGRFPQHVAHNMSPTTCHPQHVTHNMSSTTCRPQQ